jgi:two-component system, chemotaxis family, protein-glutamate methylesterase/glutaminase
LWHYTSPRREIIQQHTPLSVSYGRTGEYAKRGHVYLAPPGQHLVVAPLGYLRSDNGAKVNHVRPAADPLFSSAAAYFGQRVAGVVLTGCDGDGTAGLRAVKKAGGLSIVQHPAEAQAPQMPMSALNGDSPDWSVSIGELAKLLKALAVGQENIQF